MLGMKGKHHHNPNKFKLGILKHSLASSITQPEHKKPEKRERSVSFIENNESGSIFKNK